MDSVSVLLSVSREAQSHAEHWAQNLDRNWQEYAVGGRQSFVASNKLTATFFEISDSISILAKITEIII